MPVRGAPTAPPRAQGPDTLAELHAWVERFRVRSSWLDSDFSGQLQRLLSDARHLYTEDAARRREVILALLDVRGIVPNGFERDLKQGSYHPDSVTAGVRRAGSAALEALVGGEQGREVRAWLASEVLIQPRLHPLERRLAAVELMAGRFQDDTQLALFTCASASERAMREAAIASLAGWQDENVDRFMAGQVISVVNDPGWISAEALRSHFEKRPLSPDSPAGRELGADAESRHPVRGLAPGPARRAHPGSPERRARRTAADRRTVGVDAAARARPGIETPRGGHRRGAATPLRPQHRPAPRALGALVAGRAGGQAAGALERAVRPRDASQLLRACGRRPTRSSS